MQTAAVCVYPPFVAQAKKELKRTQIQVASVAGAFPSGQSPIELKLAEISYAINQGADDIDMVISRGKFLAGDYQTVYDFGKKVDLLTIEIEHVNIEALKQLEKEGLAIFPQPDVLEIIQHKGRQKDFFQAHHIPTAPYQRYNAINRAKASL